jgi:hypothetical protein
MGSLTKQFDHSATTSHMLSAEIDMLACSQCDGPMRLKRVLPCILQDAGTETRVLECASCGASFTRTLRLQGNSAPTKRGGLD